MFLRAILLETLLEEFVVGKRFERFARWWSVPAPIPQKTAKAHFQKSSRYRFIDLEKRLAYLVKMRIETCNTLS